MQQNKPFVITTDSMSDLPPEYLRQHDIEIISLTYTIDGVVYDESNSLPYKEFYDRMRKGAQPTTSQFNPADAEKVFERILEQHGPVDILHISISSALSGSWQSARVAAESVMEHHQGVRILSYDSQGASAGQGLQVVAAVEQRDQGEDVEQVFSHLESQRNHVAHILTVEDIIYLYRGGRVSRTQAILGGMLDIKPLIHVDNDGRLVPTGKVRGRKKSLLTLVDQMEQQIGPWKDRNKTIYITHADAEADAKFLAEQIEKRLGFKDFVITYLGTTIGVHTGPGLIALFFLADRK